MFRPLKNEIEKLNEQTNILAKSDRVCERVNEWMVIACPLLQDFLRELCITGEIMFLQARLLMIYFLFLRLNNIYSLTWFMYKLYLAINYLKIILQVYIFLLLITYLFFIGRYNNGSWDIKPAICGSEFFPKFICFRFLSDVWTFFSAVDYT